MHRLTTTRHRHVSTQPGRYRVRPAGPQSPRPVQYRSAEVPLRPEDRTERFTLCLNCRLVRQFPLPFVRLCVCPLKHASSFFVIMDLSVAKR